MNAEHLCIACGDETAIDMLGRRCYARLARNLAGALDAWRWLGDNMARALRNDGGDIITGSRTPPLPLSVACHDQREAISGMLASWARMVAEDRELTGPDNSTPPVTAAWLAPHLPWCAEQAWVDDMLAELSDAVADAHRIAPWRRHVKRLHLPCPDCQQLSLAIVGGDDWVSCRNHDCGRLLGRGYYAELVQQALDVYATPVAVEEAA
jgi:hypothetical protein